MKKGSLFGDGLKKPASFIEVVTLRDILQIIIGAAIFATPVGLTEETWNLGANLPGLNVFGFFLLSIIFVSFFSYYHYHGHLNSKKWKELFKRTVATYGFSFLVVGVILTFIQKAPWSLDFALALKRTIIVTLPASLSGAVADTIR